MHILRIMTLSLLMNRKRKPLEYITIVDIMTNDNNHYIADEGKTFVRIIDNKIMGNELYLGLFVDGSEDTIDNYKEEVENGNDA